MIHRMIHRLAVACLLLATLGTSAGADESRDCSEAYNGKPNRCIQVPCAERYRAFLGAWEGPFEAYDRQLQEFRPFHNRVTYAEADCLRNAETGETFIIGRREDAYPAFKSLPAKMEKGLLITGRRGKREERFLRTVDGQNGLVDYEAVLSNEPADLSIWRMTVPASEASPEMVFMTIDGRDLLEARAHRRFVTVTMRVGPEAKPLWQNVIARGSHTLTPPPSK